MQLNILLNGEITTVIIVEETLNTVHLVLLK